jgi:predicted carbohydrate-binding protein with CBM5 and CBM33 domain
VTQIGSKATFTWRLTASHRTQSWEYFINGTRIASIDGAQAMPGSQVSHTLQNLPEGYYTILARWNIADTPMAFYSCMDVMVTR